MPKGSGKRRVYALPNEKPDPKDRLRLRKSAQELELDEHRSHLITEISNVSTQLSIDESSSLTSARQAAQDHAALFDLIDKLRAVESGLDPELPNRNENSWREFFAWVDRHSEQDGDPPKTLAPSSRVGVSVAKDTTLLGGDEYSLVTKVPIRSGEQVFAVDRSLMLTSETAARDSDLNDFTRNDIIASGMQNVVLVLHLLNEYSKRERSHWWPYLSILPRKLLPILRLNKTKLNRHLLASAHIFEALKMFRAIGRQYTYFYKRLQATKLPLKRDFTFLYYAWGVSIVCSRQNEIPQRARGKQSTGGVVHALIPLLDMCNHDLNSNQAVFLDNASCLMAPTDLGASCEITINYGNRSSGDFYIHNGFVPDEVPGDVAPLTIALPSDALFERKVRLLKLLNMPTTMGRFKLVTNTRTNRHRRDPHLTMFLIVNSLNEQELELLLSSSSNLIAIADYIYDYIQYKLDADVYEEPKAVMNGGSPEAALGPEIDKMKFRLANCYKDYLSRRSSVCVALIERSLEELTAGHQTNGGDLTSGQEDDDKLFAIKLLQREREIYESYIINTK